jgi:asparagine synthase (glutamine-hydrolysing)
MFATTLARPQGLRKLRAMCGLGGIVDFEGAVDVGKVAQMTACLAHRGPDDVGVWDEPGIALGFRRLSILDLSPNGRQPMADPEDRYRLLHNGEVYNYLELRDQLEAHGYRFRTGTDTEVILAAYDHWGKGCVERFNGMWAFALWDRRRRELFCARDRFGIKPFYYRVEGRRLLFASELKAFRAAGVPMAASEARVREFLEHGLIDHTAETFFRGIQQLPPAHILVFGEGGVRLERYWSLEERQFDGDAVAAFRELFFDSIRLRLRSDVTIGTSLSGGLDSSAIACVVDLLMRTENEVTLPVGERQQVFTAYFDRPGLDERPYATDVVRQTRSRSHEISFSSAELLDELPAIVEAQDEPFRSTATPQWFVMRQARQAGVTVMLDGQGGDEVLAGYDGYFGYLFGDLLLGRQFRALATELGAYRRLRDVGAAHAVASMMRPFLPDGVQWAVRSRAGGARRLLHRDLLDHPVTLPATDSVFPDRFRRRLQVVLTQRLPELLRYEDRNSMAHSIEARLPYLDYRIVELMFSVDPRNLISEGRAKMMLRESLADLLPRSVRLRTDKVGFDTPEASWLNGSDSLANFAREVLTSRACRERGWVDAEATEASLQRHTGPPGSPLWRALSLELWAQTFIDGSSAHAPAKAVAAG